MTADNPEIDIYLKYAKELENLEPIIALCCKIYFIERYLEGHKKDGKLNLSSEKKQFINPIYKAVENDKKSLGISKDDRQKKFEQYCNNIHLRMIALINTPKNDRKKSVNSLLTMRNFIKILTLFGPLTPQWQKNCNFLTDF